MKCRIDFEEKIYFLLKKIPLGKVVSYKNIADKLNSKAYRAVGNALKKNKSLIEIPCHRVVRNNGDVGGYVLGRKNKIKLLKKEGIEIVNGKIDMKKYCWKF